MERLFAGRYRIAGVIHRSTSAVVHTGTHRNGSPSWIKVAASPEHASGIVLESNIANRIPSAERLRDDGFADDGLPYLVLEPVDGASLRALLEGVVTIPIAQRLGEDLAFVTSAMHVAGFGLGRIEIDDVFCAAAGGVVIFNLDRAVTATPEIISADIVAIANLVDALLAKAEPESSFAYVIERAKSGRYESVDAFLAEWQAAANGSGRSVRPRAPSLPVAPPLPSVPPPRPSAPAYERSDVLDLPYDTERSMSLVTSTPSRSPLASVPEYPRHVTAVAKEEDAKSPWFLVMGITAAVLLVIVVGGAAFLARDEGRAAPTAPPTIAAAAPPPSISVVVEPPPPVAKASPPAAPGRLRIEGGPKRMPVYVDDVVIGKTPLDAEVACGERLVRISPAKTNEIVDVPCGGERVARYIVDGKRLRYSFEAH